MIIMVDIAPPFQLKWRVEKIAAFHRFVWLWFSIAWLPGYDIPAFVRALMKQPDE